MGLTLLRLFALFLVFAGATPAAAQETKDLRILRITPEGEDVAATRQIVIEFNRPVVPVGVTAAEADNLDIAITPPLNCQWRWLNTSALSCNLGEKDAMALSTQYNVRVSPKIAAEDGAMIDEPYSHSFVTQRPAIQNAHIITWKKPGTPVFHVAFNQPVTKSSVAAHVYFETGHNGKTRHAATVSKPEYDGKGPFIVDGDEARPVWMVEPAAELPLNVFVSLKQEAGLVSAEGPETSKSETLIKQFQTFPAFAVRSVNCRNAKGGLVSIAPGDPQSEEELCNPLQPVSLSFTSPVLRSALKNHLTVTPALNGGQKNFDPWGSENRDWSRLNDQRTGEDIKYTVTLPPAFKPAQDYTLSLRPAKPSFWDWLKSFFIKDDTVETDLTDEFGRALPPFSIAFSTGHRNPNYEMAYRDAVLEKNIDSDVPLYVNNLHSYRFDYTALTASGAQSSNTGDISVPFIQDVQFAVPMHIRDILNGRSGAVYGFLETDPPVNKGDWGSRLFAQVTPYQLYAKLGHFRSAIWVTDLATGQPVPDAAVTVYKGSLGNLRPPETVLATARTGKDGLALLPGTDTLDPDLTLNRNYRDQDTRLFVRVDKGDDMALLPISYDYEVQLWNVAEDVYAINNEKYGHMRAWGMTAQGIYRAGDTIQYKIYVRNADNNRLVAPPDGDYTLEITDPAGKSVGKENVTPGDFGTIDGEYTIPQNGAVGWYNFKLSAKLESGNKTVTRDFYPMSVLVSDFTPAPFRVATDINGDRFTAGKTLDITASAALHSGGAYNDAAVRGTVTLKSRPFSPQHPAAKGFRFDSFDGETDTQILFQKEGRLNDKGLWETSFTLPEKNIVYGQLRVESAVRDDRGKSIAAEARADYLGVDRLVGLKPDRWIFTVGQNAAIQTLVVDDLGMPAAGTKVRIAFERQDVSTARVKSAGNAYVNDNTVVWEQIADCAFKSTAQAQPCHFTPETAGTYRAVATIQDTRGRAHTTRETLYVAGPGYVQWNEGHDYALTILPERTDYKVGDTARFLVKNPYPGAKAYVSIERYGVMDHFVQTLDSSTPVIEIPVKEDYIPGFYLSVIVVSPRVDAPPVDSSQIDLGKPAFRVGYAKVPVLDLHKQLAVTADTDRDVYRPRDTVTLDLSAAPRHGEVQPVELAVAVLDESVFDLLSEGRGAFDPYKGFYDLGNLDMSNYSLLTRLVGRQKFEKKGANAGGDGGADIGMRSLFKFVSYWNPSVPVNENGKARITFEAPDNLTGWRVLALAVTKDDLMGLGETAFKVNRPTELRPVMPNQVREGDIFSAGFSVMNRTDEPRTITVSIEVAGDLAERDTLSKEQTVTLAPYKRETVFLPLKAALLPASRDKAEGQISFRVHAGDAQDSDAVEHVIPVLKSRALETAAQYGSTTGEKISETIAVPENIYTDTGAISVRLSPTLLAGLDGAFRYMRDYPYPCWEQKLSVAVMASHYKELGAYLSAEWNDARELPQTILRQAADFQAPNGGMAYFRAADGYADPYLSAYTALAFQWLKSSGYDVPKGVEEKLHTYLLAFLRNKAAPSYYTDSMVATVRGVILSALKDSGKISASDIERFRAHRARMSLLGKAQYLQAASHFPQTRDIARETWADISSSGVESGGKLSFATPVQHGYERILTTALRDNCASLSALLEMNEVAGIEDKAAKITRYIIQSRGSRDHFENTQENLFCMKSLIDYAARYETQTPDMRITASLLNESLGTARFESVRDKPVTMDRPLRDGDEGTRLPLTLAKDGAGRLYYTARLRYAPRNPADNVNAGMDVRRVYSVRDGDRWKQVDADMLSLKRGDLVKIDLYLSLPAARNYVVLNDPLPGGLEIVNRDLATASAVDEDSAQGDDGLIGFAQSRWSFYHRELRRDSARYYADWLEAGTYHLTYTAQAVAAGTFAIPATQAEEMYDPDIYGRGTKGALTVEDTAP